MVTISPKTQSEFVALVLTQKSSKKIMRVRRLRQLEQLDLHKTTICSTTRSTCRSMTITVVMKADIDTQQQAMIRPVVCLETN